jgi:hypothetical protein
MRSDNPYWLDFPTSSTAIISGSPAARGLLPTSTKSKLPSYYSSSIFQKLNAAAKTGILLGTIMFLILFLGIILTIRNRRKAHQFASSRSLKNVSGTSINPLGVSLETILVERRSLDSAGIRWPDRVALTGEAKEYNDLTIEYEREAKQRVIFWGKNWMANEYIWNYRAG